MPSDPPTIYIYSSTDLGQPRGNLEDDIEDRFEDDVEVTGGGAGQSGWNIDLEMLDDDGDVHHFAVKLVSFLQKWGVPQDTYLNLYEADWEEEREPKRIDVFAAPSGA